MKALAHLNKYLYKYRLRLLLGLIITVVAIAFSIIVPKFVGNSVAIAQKYIDNEITDLSMVKTDFRNNILIILGSTLIVGVFTFLMRQTFIVVSRRIEYDLKNEVFEHYQRLSLNFYKKNRTGDLMNRISEDVKKVRMYVGPALMYSVRTVTLFVIITGYMFSIAPTLTWYTIIPLPILSISIYKLSVAINERSTIVQQYLSRLTTFTQESFSGIAVVKAYGIEAQTRTEFKALSNESKEKNLNLVKVQALFFPLMVLLIGCSNVLVIYIGGKQMMDGLIDLGIITQFIIFVNMLTWPVASVGWVTSMIQEAEASQVRINEFLKEAPQIQNTNTTPMAVDGKISFNNVTFTYEDTNITALKDISFTINKGETLAIIGKTGSGKSTILELIGRLYDTTSGTIEVDNLAIKEINLDSLRQSIGYVPQDAFLFSDKISTNIRFGKEDATDTEVEEAAKNAAVHKNIIEFSKGYDTVLAKRTWHYPIRRTKAACINRTCYYKGSANSII